MAIYRFSIEGTLSGQTVVNVQHFNFLTGLDTGQALIDSWQANVKPVYLATLPQAYSLQKLVAVNVATFQRTEEADTGAGSRVGEMTPQQCSPIVSWATGLALRRGRGRTYLPGVTEADQAAGVASAALQNAMNTWALSLLPPATHAVSWQLGILSSVDGIFRPVTSYSIRASIATQRRRRIGVGS